MTRKSNDSRLAISILFPLALRSITRDWSSQNSPHLGVDVTVTLGPCTHDGCRCTPPKSRSLIKMILVFL